MMDQGSLRMQSKGYVMKFANALRSKTPQTGQKLVFYKTNARVRRRTPPGKAGG